MTANRVWSTFEIKSFDDDARTFTGTASTPKTDRMEDIVEPMGGQYNLPVPLLWQHGKQSIKDPVGWITHAAPNEKGIPVKGKFAIPEAGDPPSLVEDLNRAWALVKKGLVRGLSIGFRPLEHSEIKGTFGVRFTKWEWLELSAVTIPANSEASILTVKELDLQSLAASGDTAKASDAVTNIIPASRATPKGNAMNIKEQLAAFEAKRAANAAAMQAIMQKTVDESRSTSTEEAAEFDNLTGENKRIDADLVRWRSMDAASGTVIEPKAGTDEAKSLVLRRGDGVLKPNVNLPKGIGLARYAKALCFSRLTMSDPIAYAKAMWDDSTPEVAIALKTAVAAGTTTDSTWASPLVYADNLAAEFLEFLRPLTIIGKLTGFRRVPFNVRYPIQDGGSTVAWVGQGAPKPVSKLSFTSASLGFAKCAGIVVITQELARFSSPSAELVVRDDLANQMVYFLDQQFIDPGVAAVSNVSPASILNNASNVRQAAAAWTTMAAVLTDIYAFMTTFAANEISLEGSYWVMTPDTALRLSLLLNTGGTDFAFPDITINGGTFMGIPVIVSNSVPHSTSAGAIIALIKPSEVFLADDGGVNITVSGEASLNMDTAPTNNSATPTATSVVSMFQTDSIAIRAERFINWARRRAYGVGYIDNMHTT